MSETPIEPDNDPSQPATDPGADGDIPGADEGQGGDVDPVQTGEPATGPEAPVPPTGSADADDEAPGGSGTGGPADL
ncbi:MAG: hypothetical protein WB508_01430 [Aeromicrobium sp.]|uniref:hypothetical protein n=1 Tax=Aeromicrobium sp. TaxID=1871063 RepID=UPI003C37B3EC